MNFDYMCDFDLPAALLDAPEVPVETWHAMDVQGLSHLVTREIMGVTVGAGIPETVEEAQAKFKPNLPWAEEQFLERVGGQPLNPPPSFKRWSHQSEMEKHLDKNGQFSHTYPERFWPKYAARGNRAGGNFGIRYRLGDLNDVIELLMKQPYTRQAYLPVFFPEDTGAHHGGRIPCSLGYQFLMREDKLNVIYGIRSCDFVRHFRDDVYMAVRLGQWVLDHLSGHIGTPWEYVKPGDLVMHIGSLHIFKGDEAKLRRQLDSYVSP